MYDKPLKTRFTKQINVLEGPWESSNFPNGEETTTGVISRKMITLLKKDGYLCEETVTREYKGNDYFDTKQSKRITKING